MCGQCAPSIVCVYAYISGWQEHFTARTFKVSCGKCSVVFETLVIITQSATGSLCRANLQSSLWGAYIQHTPEEEVLRAQVVESWNSLGRWRISMTRTYSTVHILISLDGSKRGVIPYTGGIEE